MSKKAAKYIFFVGLVLGTWAFLKGFCAACPCLIKLTPIALVVECLCFVIYVNGHKIAEKCMQVIRKYSRVLLFLCGVLIILFVGGNIEQYVTENKDSIACSGVILFTIDIIKNILGALASLWVFYLLLRPKVKIYPYLALENDGEQLKGKILIENIALTDLIDAEVLVQCRWKEDDGNIELVNLNVDSPQLSLLKGQYSEESSRAFHVTLPDDKKLYGDIKTFIEISDDVRCRVIATHSLSGIRFVKEYHFDEKSCKYGNYDNTNQFIEKKI